MVMERSDLLKKLSEKIAYQWRVQSFNKAKPEATCVAYIDARDVMNLLDEHCTEGWQNDYKEIKGNLFCGIGIKIGGEWEWRWDCGTESQTEKEKGEASDSFKRAAVKWGIGRFLYDLEIVRVPANTKKADGVWPYVVDAQGNQVWNITKYINEGKHKQAAAPAKNSIQSARPKEDRKPILSDGNMEKLIDRILKGERDLIDKTKGAFELTEKQIKTLSEI